VISLVKGRGKRNTGRGLAIAALVIDAVLLLGSILVAVLAIRGDLDTGSEPRADRTGSVALSDLAAGDCFDDADLMGVEGDEEVTAPADLTLVPCSTDHDFEVVLVFDFPESGDYPGDTELSKTALERCQGGARTYVTTRMPKDLSLYFFAPSSVTWKIGGDRTVACLAGRPGKKLTSSLHDE
jgi:hypothetical protein